MGITLFLQLFINGIINSVLYALLAIGFGIVWRSLQVFHVAYGGVFVFCTYCFLTLVSRCEIGVGVSIFFTMCFASVLGFFLEVTLYRPFEKKHASPASTLVASLGVTIVMENIVSVLFGSQLQSITNSIIGILNVGPIIVTHIQIIQFCTGLVIITIMWFCIQHLLFFKGLWAMGDQPSLIPVLGLSVNLYRSVVFILSSMLVAVPACLISLDNGTSPQVGMSYLLIAVTAVFVGGKNSFMGWVLGAVVLSVLQSIAVWKFSARWIDLVTFILLVAMLLLRPIGLLTQTTRQY